MPDDLMQMLGPINDKRIVHQFPNLLSQRGKLV